MQAACPESDSLVMRKNFLRPPYVSRRDALERTGAEASDGHSNALDNREGGSFQRNSLPTFREMRDRYHQKDKRRYDHGFWKKKLEFCSQKAVLAEPGSTALQLSRPVSTASGGPNSEDCIR